jgi:hypothetical protein
VFDGEYVEMQAGSEIGVASSVVQQIHDGTLRTRHHRRRRPYPFPSR